MKQAVVSSVCFMINIRNFGLNLLFVSMTASFRPKFPENAGFFGRKLLVVSRIGPKFPVAENFGLLHQGPAGGRFQTSQENQESCTCRKQLFRTGVSRCFEFGLFLCDLNLQEQRCRPMHRRVPAVCCAHAAAAATALAAWG